MARGKSPNKYSPPSAMLTLARSHDPLPGLRRMHVQPSAATGCSLWISACPALLCGRSPQPFRRSPRHPATRGHDLHIGIVCRKPEVAKRATAPTIAGAAASAGNTPGSDNTVYRHLDAGASWASARLSGRSVEPPGELIFLSRRLTPAEDPGVPCGRGKEKSGNRAWFTSLS
jgi:hypothetical protein